MTTANEEFSDLMPHRIKVTDFTGLDDYGRPIEPGVPRTYRCLIDDSTTIQRDAEGREVTVALTAYVAPVPIGAEDNVPVDIEKRATVEILSPRPQTRSLQSIERHYDSEDGVGMLHNLVLRFQ